MVRYQTVGVDILVSLVGRPLGDHASKSIMRIRTYTDVGHSCRFIIGLATIRTQLWIARHMPGPIGP